MKTDKKQGNIMKVCRICNMEIIIPGEEYCILNQFDNANTMVSEGNYHLSCFRDKFMQNKKVDGMIKRTMGILERAEEKFA